MQSIIEFPKQEGRGAVFSINNVPFHSYNSYFRNDQLCEYIGLIIRDKSNKFQRDWEVNASTSWKRGDGVTLEDLQESPYDHYGLFPGIASWQKEGIYLWGLVAPLDFYIERSLTRQANLGDFIPREDGAIASKAEIARALEMLNEYRKSLVSSSSSDVVMNHMPFQKGSL